MPYNIKALANPYRDVKYTNEPFNEARTGEAIARRAISGGWVW
jgi:hypothetical protein